MGLESVAYLPDTLLFLPPPKKNPHSLTHTGHLNKHIQTKTFIKAYFYQATLLLKQQF